VKRWEPDLTPEQFQAIIHSHPEGYMRHVAPGLQDGAWFKNGRDELCIRIPWRQYTIADGRKAFGQIIKAHDTHLKVMNGIHHIHNTILDVGGYDGIWSWLFDAQEKDVIDICEEALFRWAAIHANPICLDAKYIGDIFQPDFYDVVFLLDVLEHMEEESALAAIEGAEKIARYQVIVATPDGYQPFDNWQSIVTPDSDVPCPENMVHKSGWSHEFFQERGYNVIIQPNLHKDIGGGDGLIGFYNKWEQ